MKYKPTNCEASVDIYNKEDCAFHAILGWSQTEWHTHKKGQLIYGEYGIVRVYTRDAVFYVPSSHVIWIPAGVEHRVMTESVKLRFRTLYLDCSRLNDAFYNSISLFFADTLLKEMILYTARFDLVSQASGHERSFLSAIKEMLPVYTTRSIRLMLPVTENPKLMEINDYISDHIGEKINAEDLARRFGFSSRTLLRLFQKEFRISFSQYLKQIRIIKAVEMLVKPGVNVSEVAYSVGYESVPTFSNNFKEIMSVRPHLFLQKPVPAIAQGHTLQEDN